MQAYQVTQHGGPEVLRRVDLPIPEPAAGEARVRVLAVALNHLDVWVRRGVPGHRFALPLVPGSDIVGRVEVLGPPTERAGDTVGTGDIVIVAPNRGCGRCESCAAGDEPLCRHHQILGETCDGGCAEYVVAPLRYLVPVPAGISVTDAASLPLALLTAWHMVVARAGVRPGETVLVQAGGSGVGVMALQICRMLGARVFTTVGSAEKAARARQLGAAEIIDYRTQDVATEVKRLTRKRGVDVIVDHVGAATFDADVRSLAKGGRLVVCGATSGPAVSFDLRMLFFKSLSFLGSTMGRLDELHQALRMVSSGHLRPVVDRVLPMEELAEAHRVLEAREAFGKVVLRGFGVSAVEAARIALEAQG